MVASIEKQLSAEAAYGRLQSVRWLAQVIGDGIEDWLLLTPAALNRVVDRMRREGGEATVYNRAGMLSTFIDFLNSTRISTDERASSLLGRYIAWNHGLKNPIGRPVMVDDGRTQAHPKYIPDLHRALGEARSRIRLKPDVEPSPGYDLIRLEALTFAMATGIRVGELCVLSVRCLGTDESSGTTFVRVATEKGQPASARPIADIWAAPVSDAYDYLLERCEAARLRAKEIETTGFQFVIARLHKVRLEKPIEPSFLAQLDVLSLAPDRHFRVEEMARAFDASPKEFTCGGRFYDCTVSLPRVVAARVVRWIDERMNAGDWLLFSAPRTDARTGQVGSRTLSAKMIAAYVGGGEACLPKARWFYEELRLFLVALSRAGALEGAAISIEDAAELKRYWLVVRKKALASAGGGKCTAVDVEKFIETLADRYRSDLERHYRDLISYDDEGVPSTGREVRVGVPEKLSDHLIVVWEGEFSSRVSNGILPRPIFRSDFYNYLRANAQKRTVFERLGILDKKGKPYSISPHQIRHWVTTAIFRSGPSEMMVDLWMGRTPGQSRVYDHRTAKERAEVIRERYLSGNPPDDYLGRQVRLWTEGGLSAEELEEHVRSRLRVLHFVPTGGCSRELFLSPCTKGLMCLRGFGTGAACPSFHVDLKDERARSNIIALRDQYRAMLAALYPMVASFEEAFVEELNTAEVLDQHLLHIREVVRGCDQALAAYENAAIGRAQNKVLPLRVII